MFGSPTRRKRAFKQKREGFWLSKEFGDEIRDNRYDLDFFGCFGGWFGSRGLAHLQLREAAAGEAL